MSEFVQIVKKKSSIVGVVSEYVKLKKVGAHYVGLCPFHQERSPSFSVSDQKGIFYCFGCKKNGDVITFLQEVQSLSFYEAITWLAKQNDVEIPATFRNEYKTLGKKQNPEAHETQYKLNRFVAEFYHQCLFSPAGEKALQYLYERGLSKETIQSAYLGYAPANWAALSDFLNQKKAPLQLAEELGLIRKKDQRHYDYFRNRVLFPVLDVRGRVIGFGGRQFGHAEGPKYLNSPESVLFKKSQSLYGLFQAQKNIRAEDRCIIVEGYMDCLALHQAGIPYAVATLGTALSMDQAQLLKRLTKNIYILFDGDAAGQQAQVKLMEAFLSIGIVVRGIVLPDGLDPDDYIQKNGSDALQKQLEQAPYLLDQYILEKAASAAGHREAKNQALDQLLPWVVQIESSTSRWSRLQELAQLFDVPIEGLEKLTARKGIPSAVAKKKSPITASKSLQSAKLPKNALDWKLIEYLLRYGDYWPARGENAPNFLEGIESEAIQQWVRYWLEWKAESGKTGLKIPAQLFLSWAEGNDELLQHITENLFLSEMQAIHEKSPQEIQEIMLELKDLETKLEKKALELRKEQLRTQILKAEGQGDRALSQELVRQYHEVVKRLR